MANKTLSQKQFIQFLDWMRNESHSIKEQRMTQPQIAGLAEKALGFPVPHSRVGAVMDAIGLMYVPRTGGQQGAGTGYQSRIGRVEMAQQVLAQQILATRDALDIKSPPALVKLARPESKWEGGGIA